MSMLEERVTWQKFLLPVRSLPKFVVTDADKMTQGLILYSFCIIAILIVCYLSGQRSTEAKESARGRMMMAALLPSHPGPT